MNLDKYAGTHMSQLRYEDGCRGNKEYQGLRWQKAWNKNIRWASCRA